MADQVFVQVRFAVTTKYGQYQDALYFTQAEYATKSPAELASLKQARADNYVSTIDNAPVIPAPSKAALQAQKAELQAQITQLDSAIAKA